MEDNMLPIKDKEFRKDITALFSISNEDLDLLIRELEKKGTLFSEDDIRNIAKLDPDKAYRMKITLLYIIIKIKEGQQRVKQELLSIELDSKKLDFIIGRVTAVSDDTYQACSILLDLAQYLSNKSHIGSLTGELNFTPLYINEDRESFLIPLIRIKIKTHSEDEDELSQEISIAISARQLQRMISDLQELLSLTQSEAKELKNLLGKKVIMTLGDD